MSEELVQAAWTISDLDLPEGYTAKARPGGSVELYLGDKIAGIVDIRDLASTKEMRSQIELFAWKVEAQRWKTQATILESKLQHP